MRSYPNTLLESMARVGRPKGAPNKLTAVPPTYTDLSLGIPASPASPRQDDNQSQGRFSDLNPWPRAAPSQLRKGPFYAGVGPHFVGICGSGFGLNLCGSPP